MNHDQIVKHSKNAYNQWKDTWRKHAKHHAKYTMKSMEDFRNTGIGKAVLLVANGYSFEEEIETIKKYKDNVDIVACDKTIGHLLDNGITPQYCIVCDAVVSYEKYLEPYKDKLQDTILIQNVCGNPKWSDNGNWKDRYFYVNKDVMNYEKEFIKLSGCKNIVTAGTNVSNMMVVLLTQSDNDKKQNLFSYDKMLLIGFDYCWRWNKGYYAFDKTGGGKHNYMRHITGISKGGEIIYTSNNLSSSASWLGLYLSAFKFNVVQCSQHTISNFGRSGKLEEQMQYRHKPSDSSKVISLLREKASIASELNKIDNELKAIATDHWLASQSI